jgi:hypothetical protein
MLSRKSRRWGDRDDDDGEEEVVEVDNNDKTTTTSAPPPPATNDPSPPRRIHPPRPSPVSPGGGGTRGGGGDDDYDDMGCCTGGGWTSATPTPKAPMRWRGVVIDKLIPSLFSGQKTCLWTEHHTWWGGQTKGTIKNAKGYEFNVSPETGHFLQPPTLHTCIVV